MNNDEEDHFILALRQMTIAAEKEKSEKSELMTTIKRLEETIVAITTERDNISEDYAALSDRIAELEAKELDDKTKRESLQGYEELDKDGDAAPKLHIPEWRISYITNRIAQGERPTIYNMMYIDAYSKDSRYNRAARFRSKIVSAFQDLCINFANEKGIDYTTQEIPKDFEEVKMKLHDLATVNNREFIRKFFKANI
jgi:hypothetical protein